MEKEKKTKLTGIIMLVVCTILFGLAFVAQKSCANNNLTPFYINSIRFAIAGIVILPLAIYSIKKQENVNIKLTIIIGILVGLVLGIATNFQQFGIERTNPGKAGFLTAMYIIFVPIFSLILFKKKINYKQIIGIVLAVIGVGLLSLKDDFSINLGDILCLISAIFFTIQILLVDHYGKKINTFMMSCISFFTVSITSIPFALGIESIDIESLKASILPILFLGIGSSCIAYTLQNLGQKRLDGTPASLIMSLESVFSVIFSLIILNELLTLKEWIGCAVLLSGVIIVQIFDNKKESESNKEI